MSAKNWVFTLNNPTPAETSALLARVAEPSSRLTYDVQYILWQLEIGDLESTPHYQGYVQFTKKKRMTTVKSIIADRSHVEIAGGGSKDNYNYCTKVDGRIEGPFEYGMMVGGQGTRNDIVDFVRRAKSGAITEGELIEDYGNILAKYPRFVSTVRRHYSRPEPIPFCPRSGWQLDLTSDLLGIPDPRKVYWYWEAVGNSGKSYFALNFNNGGRFGYVVTGGRHSDIYFAYKDETIVFFDWARDNEESFPYRVVENFKNGYFLNTKYETFPHRFAVPHVVVFANFPPDVSKLSNDRWIIKNI